MYVCLCVCWISPKVRCGQSHHHIAFSTNNNSEKRVYHQHAAYPTRDERNQFLVRIRMRLLVIHNFCVLLYIIFPSIEYANQRSKRKLVNVRATHWWWVLRVFRVRISGLMMSTNAFWEEQNSKQWSDGLPFAQLITISTHFHFKCLWNEISNIFVECSWTYYGIRMLILCTNTFSLVNSKNK